MKSTITGLALILALVSPTRAVEYTWDNTKTSGNWNDTANWGGVSYPGSAATDVARVGTPNPAVRGTTYTRSLTVNGSYTFGTLALDYPTVDTVYQSTTPPATGLFGTSLYLNGAGTGALSMTNLQVMKGASMDITWGYYIVDKLYLTNISVQVGAEGNRGTIAIARRTYNSTHRSPVYAYVYGQAGTTFTAYLTSLQIGITGTGDANYHDAHGFLDLSAVSSCYLDVAGDVELSVGQDYREGTLRLKNGTATITGNLNLAWNGGTKYNVGAATMSLTNTTFTVGSAGRVNMIGWNNLTDYKKTVSTIAVTVAGVPGGLDIQNSASTGLQIGYPTQLNDTANRFRISVTLQEPTDTSFAGWYWGLRWAGNHQDLNTQDFSTATGSQLGLRALIAASNTRLLVDFSALSTQTKTKHLNYLKILDPATYGSKTIGDLTAADFVLYDSTTDSTYVGAYLPPRGGTLVVIR